MLKSMLLTLSLSLSSCANLPEFPEVVQYGVYADVNPPGFYGVNNKTKQHVFKRFVDPSMKAAQCLDAKDYQKSEAWVKEVIEIAKQRCQ